MIYGIIIVVGVIFIVSLLVRKKEDIIFEADFVAPNKVASRWNHSFCIGSTNSYLSAEIGYRNILICGKSGSGKGANFITSSIFNILARTKSSMVIVDPGGELLKNTSGYAMRKKAVFSIDYSDPSSMGFNPFTIMTTDDTIDEMVHVLVVNSGAFSGGESFWILSAEQFISFWCKVVVTQEEKYRSFANVLKFIDEFATRPAETTDMLLVKLGKDLCTQYKGYCAMTPATMQGIIAQARACLKLFRNPAVIATTSMEQSIDIDAIRREQQVIYITTPIPKLEYLRPVISMLIQSLYDRFLSRLPESNIDLPVYMILDEASSYKINNFSVYMSNARRFLMPTMIAIQEKSSLEHIYKGLSRNVISNCFTQCILPGTTDANTLRELSQLLGEQWRIDEETKKKIRQPLLGISEISRLEDKAVVVVGSNPTLISLKPFYKHWRYRHYAQLPPYEAKTNYSKEIPVISFD